MPTRTAELFQTGLEDIGSCCAQIDFVSLWQLAGIVQTSALLVVSRHIDFSRNGIRTHYLHQMRRMKYRVYLAGTPILDGSRDEL